MAQAFFLRLTVFLGVGLLAYGASEQPQRIHSVIEDSKTFRLQGNTRPVLQQAEDQGEVSAALPLPRMTMHFALTGAQQKALQNLLTQQTTRHSAQFHKWLTPEEYGERFGLNSKDMNRVTEWLQAQGFSNIEAARSRTNVSFTGTAAQARNAFHTSIHHYIINGETHFANASDPELPKALDGVVQSIRGLNDIHPKPHFRPVAVKPHFTSSLTGDYFLTPADFATIYDINPLYGNAIDGTGETIIIPGQTDIALSDIEAFRTAAGLPKNDPQITVVGTDPGTITADEGESDLDIEWAGGIAKNADILFVTSQNVTDAETYAINNNLGQVMSVTYGLCEASTGLPENNSMSAMFQQANAQGMTIVAAAGDSGAADCDPSTTSKGLPNNTASQGLAVDLPAALPYVTGVGGTEFTGDNNPAPTYWKSASGSDVISSALSYIPETAWNDSSAANGLSASGGGASMFNAKPSWQTGTGVPNDGWRDVPDLSFSASPNHDGYLYCTAGSCVNGFRLSATDPTNPNGLTVVGGTSADTPSFAGIVALLDQETKTAQGNINPTLYLLASFSADAFHDITTGNNIVNCQAGTPNCPAAAPFQFGFAAGTGYDQVTGLGSVDAYKLITEWTGDFAVAVQPTALSVSPSSSQTATVTITGDSSFAGTVSFTCTVPATLANVTCSIPGTVTKSGTATLTITAASTAAAPPWGRFHKFPRVGGPGLFLVAAGMLLLAGLYVFGQRFRTPLRTGALSVGFVLLLMVGITSCGDGSSSTTSTVSPVITETGNVSVTATSGTLSYSTSVAVTVQ